MKNLILIGILLLFSNVSSAKNEITITTAHGSIDENSTKKILEKLLKTYDLSDYFFTHKVLIDEKDTPHSHPILTLHTRQKDMPDKLLSTFLHEQIHWTEDLKQKQFNAAMAELAQLYPDAPVGYPSGARDKESTYRHLIVNWLEFHATKRFIGEARTKKIFEEPFVYKWIYAKVLTDHDKIGAIVKKHSLALKITKRYAEMVPEMHFSFHT